MHRLILRIYYEDTDFAGVVYYANYLRFIERGRTEWVRHRGVDQRRLLEEEGLVFAVRRIEADYLAPAFFDDLVEVDTALLEATVRAWSCRRRCGGTTGRSLRRASRWSR
jgi:acyl-CoA thioester hydrolase